MELVYPKVAAASAGAPVDPPDPVAGGERAQVREFEPLALLPRDAIAGEELRLPRSHELAQLLGPGVDAKGFGPSKRLIPGEQTRRVPRSQMHVAEPVRAPAGAAEPELEQAFLADLEPERDGIPAADQLEPTRDLEQELEPRHRVAGVELHLERDLVTLEHALAVELEMHANVRLPRVGETNREQDRKRHRDQRQLRAGEDQRGEQPQRRQDDVGAKLRRRVPRHVTRAARRRRKRCR